MRALSRGLVMNPAFWRVSRWAATEFAGRGRSPERGRGDQRPVMREVLAQQVHALARAGEDVTPPQPDAVQVQFTPRPSGQARWGDRSAAQASGVGIDDAGRQAPGGSLKNTQNTAASSRRLIQVFVPLTAQVPSRRGTAVVLVACTWLPPCVSVIAIPASAPASRRRSHRSRTGALA